MYTFQRMDMGQWQDVKHWFCLTTMVEYVNNYHQIGIAYGRTYYHLKRYGSYEFNMKNGTFRHRIIKK